jgi:hypothetical protein
MVDVSHFSSTQNNARPGPPHLTLSPTPRHSAIAYFRQCRLFWWQLTNGNHIGNQLLHQRSCISRCVFQELLLQKSNEGGTFEVRSLQNIRYRRISVSPIRQDGPTPPGCKYATGPTQWELHLPHNHRFLRVSVGSLFLTFEGLLGLPYHTSGSGFYSFSVSVMESQQCVELVSMQLSVVKQSNLRLIVPTSSL